MQAWTQAWALLLMIYMSSKTSTATTVSKHAAHMQC